MNTPFSQGFFSLLKRNFGKLSYSPENWGKWRLFRGLSRFLSGNVYGIEGRSLFSLHLL